MSSAPRLFNVATVARAGGIATATVLRRIEKLKLQPAAVLDPIGRDPQPLYDETSLATIVLPFLEARGGRVDVLKIESKLFQHAMPAEYPGASDPLVECLVRRGDVPDRFDPAAK